MKVTITVQLILLLSTFSFSQNYYPLEIGNRWDYRHTYSGLESHLSVDSTTVSVIDTFNSQSGNQYFVLNNSDFTGNTYIRADSEYVYYYNESDSIDVPFFKLNSDIGEVFLIPGGLGPFSIITLEDTLTSNIFGYSTKILYFEVDGLIQKHVSLSDKFGPISSYYTGEPPGTYYETFHIIGSLISGIQFGTLINSLQYEIPVVSGFYLLQNSPNPFNPNTYFSYQVPFTTYIEINLYNVCGQKIKTLYSGIKNRGTHQVEITGNNLASGVYFYEIKTKHFRQIKKCMLIR